MSKVKVTGIEIELKGKKTTLTIGEARELHLSLATLFEDQRAPIYIPSTPIVIEKDRYPSWPRITWTSDKTTPVDQFQITCKTG